VVNTQEAPPELEPVRALLNTWSIPNDTRRPTDAYDGPAEIRALRDDLRRAVEDADPAAINPWITRLRVRPVLAGDAIGWTGRGDGAALVGAVLTAIADGTWPRLKACPDCRWVFYDHTRNGSKRWCLMTAGGPAGRSCGSIAKVRAHRERRASA
jgi:CGNR zinc finger